jgi:uncharacterized protein YdeI (YjbR/CyaY-like superfamily)
MPKLNPEVDRYIANAAAFAQPILEKIRRAYHKAHPEVEEVIKWGVPHFDYKGPLGNMAGFKQHVGYGFWKSTLLEDTHGILASSEHAMGGMKVRDVKELPSEKVLVDYIRQAIRLNEAGVKVARPKRAPAAPPEAPADLVAALRKNATARKAFESFSPSQKREYVEWITEAKQEATRLKRLTTAVEWMSEGKPRNWKYMK